MRRGLLLISGLLAAPIFAAIQWTELSLIVVFSFAEPPLCQLKNAYPTEGFTSAERRSGGDKTYQMDVLKVLDKSDVINRSNAVDPVWHAFVSDLTSASYLDALSEITQLPLRTCKIDVTFFQFKEGGGISPHLDHPGKLATQILYFNENWLESWGGGLAILNSKDTWDKADVLLPRSDRSVLLVRGDRSWHCVEPTLPSAPTPRTTLQLEFWK